MSPFAEEPYIVSESQLATPTSEVSSHQHIGSVKRLSSAFEEPIPLPIQKLKPVPKPEALPRYKHHSTMSVRPKTFALSCNSQNLALLTLWLLQD